MTLPVLAFEWRLQARQAAFAAAAVLFLLFGALLSRAFGSPEMIVNGPYHVVESMGLLSLVALFPLGVFAAGAMLRDREHRMEELVFATSVQKTGFLAGRFAGAFLASLAIFAFAVAGFVLAPLLPGADPARLGPTVFAPYAFAGIVIVLPNLLLSGTLLFGVAALGRRAALCHGASLLLYLLYWLGAALTNSPLMAGSTPGAESGGLATLLDPFGLSAFFAETRAWSLEQRNTQLPPLNGLLLGNRLLWIAVSAGLLAFIHRAFRFRLLEGSGKGRGPGTFALATATATAPAVTGLGAIPCRPSAWRAFTACLRLEAGQLVRSPFVLLFLLGWLALAAPELWSGVVSSEFGAASYARPGPILDDLGRMLPEFGTLAVLLAAAELFSRDREMRFSPLLDALPVPGQAFFAAKVAVLAALVAAVIAVGLAAAVGVQLLRSGGLQDATLYLSAFLFMGLPLLLFAVACGAVHALSPNKHAGLLLSVLLALVLRQGALIGLEHPLLQPLTLPSVLHSSLDGFGDGARAFAAFAFYGTAFAGLLFLFAGALWRREPGAGLGRRLGGLVLGSQGSTRRVAVFLTGAFIAAGSWIAVQADSRGGFVSRRAGMDWRADYERSYAGLADLPQPRPTDLEARVDLDPAARTCRTEGRLRLRNEGADSIRTVLVAFRREARDVRVSLEGARAAVPDARFGVWRFELEAPLPPGQSTDLAFAATYQGGALPEPDAMLASNGSLIFSNRILPTLGYRRGYELSRDADRLARGLPARGQDAADPEDEDASENLRADWIRTDLTISTDQDQTVVAPGRLEGEWASGGRRFFRYVSREPIRDVLAIVSARYEVHRAERGGVALEVYAHPGHGRNAAVILDIAGASLDRFQAAFGPYPHRELRLVESSARWRFGGFAAPGMILLSEPRAFLLDPEPQPGGVDLLTRRVAHEVGHQWWGHRLAASNVPGGTMLTESLTKYAELLLLDARRGQAQVERLLAVERDRYLSGRGSEAEPPLAASESQMFLCYGKGALVMWSLRDLLGEAKLNRALRSLLTEQGGPGGRGTTGDLRRHLLAVADSGQQRLIREWLEEVVLHDLKLEEATWRRRADGRIDLDLRIQATKKRALKQGGEEALAFEEAIEVGVFGAEGKGAEERTTQKTALRAGLNQISLVVDQPPGDVVLDPSFLRIETNREDNTRRARPVGSAAARITSRF